MPCGPSSLARRAREGEDGPLGRRIDERAGVAALAAGKGGQVDDAGAAAGLGRRSEMGQGGARDAAHAADVERHHLGPEGVVGLGEAFARYERAGVVDEHIKSAEELHGLGHEPVAALGFRQVGAGVAVTAAELLRLGLDGARGVGTAAVVDKNIAPGGEQLAGDGEADALGAGGDEGASALELRHGAALVTQKAPGRQRLALRGAGRALRWPADETRHTRG